MQEGWNLAQAEYAHYDINPMTIKAFVALTNSTHGRQESHVVGTVH